MFYLKIFCAYFPKYNKKLDVFMFVFVVFKKTVCCQVLSRWDRNFLSSLSSDSSGQLDVLGHDGNSLGMDGAQVGVLKQTNKVSLTGLLESHDSRGLESQVSLEVLGNLSHQTLEGQFSDEQLSRLLVSSDLSESNSSWPVSVGFLDSSSGWSRFSCSLGGQLLSWSLSSSGLSCCLLGTSHVDGSGYTDDVWWMRCVFMSAIIGHRGRNDLTDSNKFGGIV